MKNIRSVPLRDGRIEDDAQEERRRRKQTAIIDGRALRRMRTPLERFVGLFLLFGSVYGNMIAFNGGAAWPLTKRAIAFGVGIQAVLTVLQWIYKPRGDHWLLRLRDLRWQYIMSVAAGAGLSVAGYGVVLFPSAYNLFDDMQQLRFFANGVSGAVIATWVLIGVVSLVLEVIPENILVD